MMNLIAGVGGGLFMLASLVLGGRLFWLGVRKRRLPELLLGGGLMLTGGIGYPLVITAQMVPDLSDATRSALVIGHMSCNVIGFTFISYFNRRVFRPTERWAGVAMGVIVLSETLFMLLQLLDPGALVFAREARGAWNGNLYLAIVVLSWSGVESLRLYRMQRRRAAIGLGDAVVMNRMFLWGFSMLTAVTISASVTLLESLGIQVMGTWLAALISGPLGLICASTLYLAFLPPARYLRWIETRAEPLAHG